MAAVVASRMRFIRTVEKGGNSRREEKKSSSR